MKSVPVGGRQPKPSPPAQVAAELARRALADMIVLIARKIQKADRLFLGEAQLATQLGRVSGVGTAQPDLYRARIDVGVPIEPLATKPPHQLHLRLWFRIEIAFHRNECDQQSHDEHVEQPDGLGNLIQSPCKQRHVTNVADVVRS